MFNFKKYEFKTKEDFYDNLLLNIQGLISGETDLIANLANISSLGFHQMDDVNWFGFYMYKEEQLVLGPFHGNPACIRIEIGKGVCGTAAKSLETQLVPDVHAFPGHIACDGDTQSEIVVPIVKRDELIGVLDIDSPIFKRFDTVDQMYLEKLVELIVESY